MRSNLFWSNFDQNGFFMSWVIVLSNLNQIWGHLLIFLRTQILPENQVLDGKKARRHDPRRRAVLPRQLGAVGYGADPRGPKSYIVSPGSISTGRLEPRARRPRISFVDVPSWCVAFFFLGPCVRAWAYFSWGKCIAIDVTIKTNYH